MRGVAMILMMIDRGILTRGLFIAILDPTLISLFSGRLTFQVCFMPSAYP